MACPNRTLGEPTRVRKDPSPDLVVAPGRTALPLCFKNCALVAQPGSSLSQLAHACKYTENILHGVADGCSRRGFVRTKGMVFCGEWQIKEYQLAGACELRGCECPAMLDRVAASGIVRLLGEEALLQEQDAQERCALVGPSGCVDRGWDGLWCPAVWVRMAANGIYSS